MIAPSLKTIGADRIVGLQADVAPPVVGVEADAPMRRAAAERICIDRVSDRA